MKRFALLAALTAAALTGASADADTTQPVGLADATAHSVTELGGEGLQEAPEFTNQCGHWEYRTVAVPVWGHDTYGNYCIIDYRYVTRRVWVAH